MNTEEKIVARALEMFNERGIEYVGLRELAADLGIRVSNITYYFPTKDHLVNRLSLDLNKLNAKTMRNQDDDLSLVHFMERLQQAFENQVAYRCLVLSFVHLVERNTFISARYKKTQKDRNESLRSGLQQLAKNGYLKLTSPDDLEYLVSTIALVARFWLSEAFISFRTLRPEDQIRHYLSLIAYGMMPYATSKGKGELRRFLDKKR